jgi:hypothetical protein
MMFDFVACQINGGEWFSVIGYRLINLVNAEE